MINFYLEDDVSETYELILCRRFESSLRLNRVMIFSTALLAFSTAEIAASSFMTISSGERLSNISSISVWFALGLEKIGFSSLLPDIFRKPLLQF